MKARPIIPSLRRALRRKEGSALLTALLISVVLSVIVGASLLRSLYTWDTIGVSYHHDSAMHVAESGADIALFALNHRVSFPNYPGNGLEAVLRSLCGQTGVAQFSGTLEDGSGEPIGDYESAITIDSTNEDRMFITSSGTVPAEDDYYRRRTSRTVRLMVYRDTIHESVFGAAIYTPGDIGTNGVTEIHGDTVSGGTLSTVGNADPYLRVTQYPYEVDGETAYGTVDEGRNEDGDLDNDVSLPMSEFLLSVFKEMAIDQGYYFDHEPDPSELPTEFFQPDGVTPNVVFITGSIHMASNFTIGGLIFVVGDIITDPVDAEFGGTELINGIIYTTGDFRTHGGGYQNVNVQGGVFCASADLQGNAVVEYNWEYYEALKNLTFKLNTYRFSTWQELIQTAQN